MNLSTDQLVLAPDAAVDLQLHTMHSDGTWIPELLVDYLLCEHFALAAITDHDCTETAAALQQLALAKHLPILVAVEMTTTWRGEMTDLLCYGYDPDNIPLNALARGVFERQSENTREVYEKVRRQGYVFPEHPNELEAILAKPSSQQPHELAAVMRKLGHGTPEKPVGKTLVEAGIDFATTDLGAVVEAAHHSGARHSGAVCLISHPGRGDGFMDFSVELLDELRQEIPIDGLEVYHPRHNPAQTAMYLEYAQKHHLLISSGSDSHGPEKKPIAYPAHLSRDLLERLGIRVV